EVGSDKPADCPKCGMPLERATPAGLAARTIYSCPMHPEIEQEGPGSCPIRGMDLEPTTVHPGDEEGDRELADMSRRFLIAAVLTAPVFVLAMGPMVWRGFAEIVPERISRWLQFLLATPVVLWAGWPLLVRGWRSVLNRSLNM